MVATPEEGAVCRSMHRPGITFVDGQDRSARGLVPAAPPRHGRTQGRRNAVLRAGRCQTERKYARTGRRLHDRAAWGRDGNAAGLLRWPDRRWAGTAGCAAYESGAGREPFKV